MNYKGISALISGLIFGLGLTLSGMTNPSKVIGFLDVTGNWDPSLAFVMLGAISVSFFAFRKAKNLGQTCLGAQINIPTKNDVDSSLILGSVTFGIGWGLSGLCPGPALALLLSGSKELAVFVVAMVSGMAIYSLTRK